MRYLLLLPLALVFACSPSRTAPPISQVASFEIGDFTPAAETTPWANMSVSIGSADDASFAKNFSFQKVQFQSGKHTDLSFKLNYGRYTFALAYNDAKGAKLYESCSKSEIHDIKVPSYKASIKICRVGGSDPVGETPLTPSSEVTLTPKPGDSQGPVTPAPAGGGSTTAPSVKTSVGLYTILADDSDARYTSTNNWQPRLDPYQQKGFNTLYLTFIRPDTMEVPASFANLAKTRGSDAAGAVPANTRILCAVGGIAYSGSINPWPWLTSEALARSMAARVAKWSTESGCDGIDLDIEDGAGNAAGAGQNLVVFTRELKRLNPKFLVTLPVYGYPQVTATNELVNAAFGPNGEDYGLVDSVGLMVYEGTQALNFVGNYSKVSGTSRWEGFPIKADVPKNKLVLGLKGSVDDATSQSMISAVKAKGLGGVMAWYGSALDGGQLALQYDREWNASFNKSSEWQRSLLSLIP